MAEAGAKVNIIRLGYCLDPGDILPACNLERRRFDLSNFKVIPACVHLLNINSNCCTLIDLCIIQCQLFFYRRLNKIVSLNVAFASILS